jgi:hypothetical protein
MSAATCQITNFERSWVRWRIDTIKKPVLTVSRPLPMTLNNVRVMIDARAVLTEIATGRVFDYVLTTSCKTEQVWVKRDIWHQPNSDMCMIASADEFVIVKRWDKADKGMLRYPPTLGVQPERQWDLTAESFDRFAIDRVVQPARELCSDDAIIEALFAAAPVVATTEYESSGYRVLLEYPVKVVNFSEREHYYQTDTGPMLLPLFEGTWRTPLECCQMAYAAHNSPDWVEFIVCVPTPLTEGIRVHHYSRSVRVENVRNRLFAVVI